MILNPVQRPLSTFIVLIVLWGQCVQVMCNAEVQWVAWRASGNRKSASNWSGTGCSSDSEGTRAVCVADGVHVGRVLYRGNHLVGPVTAPRQRCQVVIFGRPFSFNCYELLVLSAQNAERDRQPEWISPF